MLQVGVVVVFVIAAALYAAPSIVAVVKGNRRWSFVVGLNMLLGWTVLGWLLALVVALQITPRRPAWTKRKPRKGPHRPQPEAVAARRDANDPPEVREDIYAAWLEDGAGLNAGGRG